MRSEEKTNSLPRDRTELEFLSNDLTNMIDKMELQQEQLSKSISKLSSKFQRPDESTDDLCKKDPTPETFAETLSRQIRRLDQIHAQGEILLENCRQVIA